MFVLGHDAAHGALFSSRRVNGFIGRILMLPSLHMFEAWRLGHNHIHHRHTIKQGMDFVWHPVTPTEFSAMSRPQRLRHRIEWSALGAGVYYTRNIWLNRMVRLWKPPAKWASGIKRDRAFVASIMLVVSVAFFLFGGALDGHFLSAAWLVVRVLVVPFLLFQWIIGFTVYMHHIDPNIAWTRRTWTAVRAQLMGTTVLRLPWGANFFFHWIFEHVPHHVDVRIPCYNLARATESIKKAFPGLVIDRKLRLRDYVRTTRACKLFDFDTGLWHTYRSGLATLTM
jgi:omega-6 fatty acid desaturase (delta-12 desaturase)